MSRPGLLKHRVSLQKNTPARNTYGEQIDSWTTIATVYGRVEPLTALERLSAGKDTPVATHRVHVRHRGASFGSFTFVSGGLFELVGGGFLSYVEEVGEAQRLLYDNRTFGVVSVQDIDERHRYDTMIVKEVSVNA
jgi:head-tail adaptor